MRKIIAGLFISLDGVVEGPGHADDFERAGWQMAYFSDEMGHYIGGTMMTSDVLLLGRKTYQGFADAFGSQSGGMADTMNNFPKLVVSNTLERAEWQNSTLISGSEDEVMAQLKAIKAQDGQNINMSGSITLVRALLKHGLLDELDLLVHPVVVGMGMRLFDDDFPQMALKLIETRPLPNGVVLLRYATAA